MLVQLPVLYLYQERKKIHVLTKSGMAKAASRFSKCTSLTASDGLAFWDNFPFPHGTATHVCGYPCLYALSPFLLCKHRTGTYRSSHHNFTHPLPDINSIELKPSTNNCPITMVKIFNQLLYSQVNSKRSEVPVSYLVFKLK